MLNYWSELLTFYLHLLCIPVIFYHFIWSILKHIRYLMPLIAIKCYSQKQSPLLFQSPTISIYLWIQLIYPSLLTTFATFFHFPRNHMPIMPILIDQISQFPILLWTPSVVTSSMEIFLSTHFYITISSNLKFFHIGLEVFSYSKKNRTNKIG